jgi:hypothetical protein
MHVAPEAAFGLLLVGFVVFAVLAFFAALMGFWIWMLIDCAVHTPDENNQKLVWILIVVLTGWIGALVYFFVQRPKNRLREGYRS